MSKDEKTRSNHREVELLDALRCLGGSARNANLAEILNVSEETVRRTAKALAKADLVQRVHGGVYLANIESEDSVFSRLGRRSVEKNRIAMAAAALVPDGSSLYFDVGSTTAFVAEALQSHENLTVVTNSLAVAQALVNRNGSRVFLAGGELRPTEYGAFGRDAQEFVKRFFYDIAFFSADAVDTDAGFLLASAEEAEVVQAAFGQARRKIVVVDHEKFGHAAPVVACKPDDVDMLVTDRKLSPAFAKKFKRCGVEVVVADEET